MATKWVDRISMFRSARWNLTLFYLGVIVLFNLIVTLSVRVYAEHEFNRSNLAQRSQVHTWVGRDAERPRWRPEEIFLDIQNAQAEIVRQHLNQGLLVINLGALLAGGVLSYWFAGRTLKPIEQAHEAQARFTADASHELRTPLASMRLENEVFLRQAQFSEADAREQLTSNLEEVQRLENLANNLLALHQYGRQGLERSQVDMQRLVHDACKRAAVVATAKQVTIHQAVAAQTVLLHRVSMAQVLDILLDNALKYGASGGEIFITGVQKKEGYTLTVRDKGPGLVAADIPRLFDRLYRGDKARSGSVAGFGLGLSLAKEIIQANGAALQAYNHPEGGAVFEVRFAPAAPKEGSAAA